MLHYYWLEVCLAALNIWNCQSNIFSFVSSVIGHINHFNAISFNDRRVNLASIAISIPYLTASASAIDRFSWNLTLLIAAAITWPFESLIIYIDFIMAHRWWTPSFLLADFTPSRTHLFFPVHSLKSIHSCFSLCN